MKKTLANDKVFTDALTATYGEVCDYTVKHTSNYLRLGNGMVHLFPKPPVETRFCFGHGQNGISTDEEQEFAHDACKAVSEKEGFFAANMEYFSDYDKFFREIEENHSKIYAFVNRTKGYICDLFCDYDIWEMKHYYGQKVDTAYVLTENDIANLKKMVEEEKAKFIKRLETYWKRFGNTKLHTWTYLVD